MPYWNRAPGRNRAGDGALKSGSKVHLSLFTPIMFTTRVTPGA